MGMAARWSAASKARSQVDQSQLHLSIFVANFRPHKRTSGLSIE